MTSPKLSLSFCVQAPDTLCFRIEQVKLVMELCFVICLIEEPISFRRWPGCEGTQARGLGSGFRRLEVLE